jgi:hypothetical protein
LPPKEPFGFAFAFTLVAPGAVYPGRCIDWDWEFVCVCKRGSVTGLVKSGAGDAAGEAIRDDELGVLVAMCGIDDDDDKERSDEGERPGPRRKKAAALVVLPVVPCASGVWVRVRLPTPFMASTATATAAAEAAAARWACVL